MRRNEWRARVVLALCLIWANQTRRAKLRGALREATDLEGDDDEEEESDEMKNKKTKNGDEAESARHLSISR